MDGITASNNTGHPGLLLCQSGAITIKNSAFVNNNNLGIANFPSSSGIVPTANIVLSNVHASDNFRGMALYTKGKISLTDVHADDNEGYGANLDTCYEESGACTWFGSGVVTINDSTFDDNHASVSGLHVTARGAISITNVSANGTINSDGWDPNGATLYNMMSDLSSPVTITNSEFSFNDDRGLYVISSGAITLNKVKAINNQYGDGIRLDNVDGTAGITITGSAPYDNQFNVNGGDGAYLISHGSISIKYADACDNSANGMEIHNTNGVSSTVNVKNGLFLGNGIDPKFSGLVISSRGTISIYDVAAGDNAGHGATLDNALASKAVAVSSCIFNYNGSNGLYVLAKGTITLNDVYAGFDEETHMPSGNDMYGAELDNSSGNGGVVIKESYFGYSGTDLVAYDGLHVTSKGAISLTTVTTVTNYGYGTYLDNTGGTGGVSIIEGNFSYNHVGGLYVRSKGAITISQASAHNNLGVGCLGADLANDGSLAYPGVTITNSDFFNNYATGLSVHSRGNISLTNVASYDNNDAAGSYGADLWNTSGTGYVKILNRLSTDYDMQPGFNNNHDRGINIHTNGTVTLTNVNILNNQEDGIYIWLEENKGVTLKNCRVDGNVTSFGAAGILIDSLGPIVINGGHANENNAYGVYLLNSEAADATPEPITISNFTADENLGYGIYAESKGPISLTSVAVRRTTGASMSAISLDNHWLGSGISLSNVTSLENNGVGINLITNGAVTFKTGVVEDNTGNALQLNEGEIHLASAVILSNLYLQDNGGYGAEIYNSGAISLTNVHAVANLGGVGMILDNFACSSCPVSILYSGTGFNEFNYNVDIGLYIHTKGTIVMNKVNALGNQIYGALVQNAGAATPVNVTISNGLFSGNHDVGLLVQSKGVISVTGVEANGNLGLNYGADLNNTFDDTGTKGVNVTKSKFDWNTGTGLYITTNGAVVLNSVQVSNNSFRGVDIMNNDLFTKPVTILASYYANNFSSNGSNNLHIVTYGVVSITNAIADLSETGVGFYITSGSAVTLSKVTARFNATDGIYISTLGNITISGITSMFNQGIGGSFAGLYINTNGSAAAKVTIKNGVITSNADYGIELNLAPSGLYTLTSVFFYGNDTDHDGQPNLIIY